MKENITREEENGITSEYLKSLFYYKENENSGYLIWRIAKAYQIKPGDLAGTLHKSTGYYEVIIDYKQYRLHRLIFI